MVYGGGVDGLYDDMYYYDQLNGGMDGLEGQFGAIDFAGLDPEQRVAQIQQLRAMAAANGQLNEGFDSDDDAGALFFDNNDLANRIWEEEQVLDG